MLVSEPPAVLNLLKKAIECDESGLLIYNNVHIVVLLVCHSQKKKVALWNVSSIEMAATSCDLCFCSTLVSETCQKNQLLYAELLSAIKVW